MITGGVKGALVASGAGLVAGLVADFAAGAAGSALEQKIGTGRADLRQSITDGLINSVSGAIYGNKGFKNVKQAFKKGAIAGAAGSAIRNISDAIGRSGDRISYGTRPSHYAVSNGGGIGTEQTTGGTNLSGKGRNRDPKEICRTQTFLKGRNGYGRTFGYQYPVSRAERTVGSRSIKRNGFDLGDFIKDVAIGAVLGGLGGAGIYGVGKAVGALGNSVRKVHKGGSNVRNRIGKPVDPMDITYDMRLNPEMHAYEVANKYGINLRGSGQKIRISYNPKLASAGRTRAINPSVIEVGPGAYISEEELANTIAHELNHSRSFLRGGTAPEWGIGGAYPAGNALADWIRGGR